MTDEPCPAGLEDPGAGALRRDRHNRSVTAARKQVLKWVRILRHEETVPGAFGDVRCMRYSIAAESLERARELLAQGGAP